MKYLSLLIAAISFISMFQSKIDLGESLDAVIEHYKGLRNLIFSPFQLVGISLPERLMNTLFLLTTISVSFALKGDDKNKFAVKGLIEGLICGIIGYLFVVLSLSFSKNEELIRKMDEIGFSHLSIKEMSLVILSYLMFLPGLLFFGNFMFWTLALIFPFLITIGLRIPVINISTFLFIGNAILNNKVIKVIIPKLYNSKIMSEYTPEKISSTYNNFWSKDEYFKYYTPLRDWVIAIFGIILIFKVIIENMV